MRPLEYLGLVGLISWGCTLVCLAGFSERGLATQAIVLLCVCVLYLAEVVERKSK